MAEDEGAPGPRAPKGGKRKKKKRAAPSSPAAPSPCRAAELLPASTVATGWLPRWAGRIVAGIALLYLATVFLETAGTSLKIVPRPLLYFAQVAALFPRAVPF